MMEKLSADEVQRLADHCFSHGVSVISIDQPKVKADLILASRTLRALLRAYETSTGRQLRTVLVCGGSH